MGEKCGVLEVTKTTNEDEKSDDFELSLELSIGGGKYGKSEKIEGSNHNNDNYCGISRSDCSREPVWDLHRRKEIQAFFRRQEARRKREEKLKRPRRVGLFENNNNNNKMPEAQQRLQPGIGDRGTGEIYGFIGEKIRNNGNDELGLSLFTENKNVEIRDCLLYPKVQYLPPSSYGYGEGEAVSNGSLERSSSAVSDYQSTSHKGGTSSDTGSHSTPSRLNQHHIISGNEFDQHLTSNGSSCQTEPDRHLGGRPTTRVAPLSNSLSSRGPFSDKPKVVSTDESRPDQPNNNNNACSTSYNRSPPRPEQTIGGGPGGDKSVKPLKMPCVSTTGNGPNGRTVRGFLYKYTKTEVSIVCVCHGSSFSPAGFVEHAGGVDISHPLKHITIVRSAFG
ncbi:hypothetical protein OROGR_027910 [Orobanche gracilis]